VRTLPEAAEQFVAVWANPIAAAQIAGSLTNSEVLALAELLSVMGEPGIAQQWIDAHKQN
jgi:hypothetical protein